MFLTTLFYCPWQTSPKFINNSKRRERLLFAVHLIQFSQAPRNELRDMSHLSGVTHGQSEAEHIFVSRPFQLQVLFLSTTLSRLCWSLGFTDHQGYWPQVPTCFQRLHLWPRPWRIKTTPQCTHVHTGLLKSTCSCLQVPLFSVLPWNAYSCSLSPTLPFSFYISRETACDSGKQ